MENSSPQFNYSESPQSKNTSIDIQQIVNEVEINYFPNSPKKQVQDSVGFQSIEKLLTSSQQGKNNQEKNNLKESSKKEVKLKSCLPIPQSLPLFSKENLQNKQKVKISYLSPPPRKSCNEYNQFTFNGSFNPRPVTWIERLPYSRKVIDYEERVVYVPVQRIQRGEYEVEHIVEYVKKQTNQVRMELKPIQYVNYKLQYVPVQTKIIHLPERIASQRKQYHDNPENGIASTGQFTFREKIKYVTTPEYDFRMKAEEMELIEKKMMMLKEKEKQLRPSPL